MNMETCRRLPYDVDIEQTLLGACLMDESALHRAELEASDFYDGLHQKIWRVIAQKRSAAERCTPITVHAVLSDDSMMQEVGGRDYLISLARAAPALPHIEGYTKILIDLAARRRLIGACEEDIEEATIAPIDADSHALLGRHEDKIRSIQIGAVRADDPVSWEATGAEVIDRMSGQSQAVRLQPYGIAELDNEIGGMGPGDLIIVGGRPGMGKQQPIDSTVLTPFGWAKLGALKLGDEVIGQSGRPIRVTGIYPQGTRQAFQVKFRDGTSVECGEEHLWSVASSDGRARRKFVTRSLKSILAKGLTRRKAGNRIGARWRIPLVLPVQFSQKALPIDPYVLGVMIGDGSLSNKDLRFSNPDMDADIRQRIRARLPSDIELHENRSGACPYFDLRGPGKRNFRTKIAALGLNVRSPDKFIPSVYLFGAEDQRLDLLRGLMDTDGSCLKNRTHFYTTAGTLADGVAHLVRSLGGVAIVRRYDRPKHGKPTEFAVNVKMTACPFYTKRKVAQWRPQKPSRYIWAVEPGRVVEQTCISVDADDGLYLTDSFIVTHNSAIALTIAHAAAGPKEQTRLDLEPTAPPQSVGVFLSSLEMGRHALAERSLSMAAFAKGHKIPYSLIRLQRLSDHQKDVLADVFIENRALPFEIDDRRGLKLAQIGVRMRRAQARFKRAGRRLGLGIVDHLGLIEPDEDYRGNKVAELTATTRGLKILAGVLGIPLIVLCQLSRAVEAREDKRPYLSDLRESGSIEQDADAVILLHRPEYYLIKSKPEDSAPQKERDAWQTAMDRETNRLNVYVPKNRNGPEASIRLTCHMAYNAIGG